MNTNNITMLHREEAELRSKQRDKKFAANLLLGLCTSLATSYTTGRLVGNNLTGENMSIKPVDIAVVAICTGAFIASYEYRKKEIDIDYEIRKVNINIGKELK